MSESATVLVVEDDDDLRGAVEWALDEEGYRVVTAANGAEALEQVDHEQPDLILLDMRMPVMDGWGFARSYRQRTESQVPIVVVTAAQDAARWALEIQAAGYLAKPFDIDELLQAVARHAA
jgi:two-component system chemotaxis response regulator CheY